MDFGKLSNKLEDLMPGDRLVLESFGYGVYYRTPCLAVRTADDSRYAVTTMMIADQLLRSGITVDTHLEFTIRVVATKIVNHGKNNRYAKKIAVIKISAQESMAARPIMFNKKLHVIRDLLFDDRDDESKYESVLSNHKIKEGPYRTRMLSEILVTNNEAALKYLANEESKLTLIGRASLYLKERESIMRIQRERQERREKERLEQEAEEEKIHQREEEEKEKEMKEWIDSLDKDEKARVERMANEENAGKLGKCRLRKHKGTPWLDVLENNPQYVRYILGDPDMSRNLTKREKRGLSAVIRFIDSK